MALDITADPRFENIATDEGREELAVYLQWIDDSGIEDTQKSFIDFVVGRAGLEDGRHLFNIWRKQMGSTKVELKTSLEMMKFFINPNHSAFNIEAAAGWFDFLTQVYELVDETPPQMINRPDYKMVGVPLRFAK